MDGVASGSRALASQYDYLKFTSDGANWKVSNDLHPGAWTTYAMTVSSAGGSITTYDWNVGSYIRMGKIVFFHGIARISNNGTGSGKVIFTLPFAAKSSNSVMAGRDNGVSGKALVGIPGAGTTTLYIGNYDDSYPAQNNSQIVINGTYEAN